MPKTFTKLVVCSLILKACISKCHLEVVVLSLIICLECEEVTRAEGRNKKKETKKGGFGAVFFSLWILCMNLVLLKGQTCSAHSED